MDNPAGHADLNRLRWRCRRGLLENDLIIDRFFVTHGERLTDGHAATLMALMDLADNDLLDLFLSRTEPAGDLANPATRELLALMRRTEASSTPEKGNTP